jgi:hypothetical protein
MEIPSGTLDGKFSIQFYFPSVFHPRMENRIENFEIGKNQFCKREVNEILIFHFVSALPGKKVASRDPP